MNNLREIIQIFSYSFTHALQQYLRNLVQWVEKKPSYLFKLIYEFLISVLRLIKTRQFADTFSLSRVLESIKAVNLVPRVSHFGSVTQKVSVELFELNTLSGTKTALLTSKRYSVYPTPLILESPPPRVRVIIKKSA